MLDCLNVTASEPSQQDTQVVIVQRLLSWGRSMLNVLEVHDAIAETGAQVQVFSTEGELFMEANPIETLQRIQLRTSTYSLNW